MSESVDTRIVEAKFNSEQFEQGVNRTVKKLDELKKSLNLADTGKSITDLADKTQKASDKASQSLEKLESRFTSFAGMLRQKFVSGIADEIVGVFFRIKSSFEGLVRSLSSTQISYGMQRYTDILTSVRTLVSAGEREDTSYKVIERLGDYADQTSYSLDQLVSTMSKFKTSGASLETAQRMVEGLSNAAASMGVNAQDATRAYLNLQQAYSKGAMMQNDWISFESLPMVGTNFNQAILDAAEKVGTLKKDKNGTYKTVRAKGSDVRTSGADAKGITAENLGTKLSSRWFNKQVMEEVFGNTYYFDEVGVDEVNRFKAEERAIKAQVRKAIDEGKSGLKEEDYDKEVNKRLQKVFDKENAERKETKKNELELQRQTAQKELEAKKITAEEYKKVSDDIDKQLKNLEKDNGLTVFAYNAFRAGQEARSFTDVLNTLKDTISRGWAKSFEIIFGQLSDAADFFTMLTESNLAEAIYAIGDFRNAVLESWAAYGGRENMLSFIQALDDSIGSVMKKLGIISYTFDDLFDEEKYKELLNADPSGYAANQYKEGVERQVRDSENAIKKLADDIGMRLSIMGRDFRDLFERISAWFNHTGADGETRIQKIVNLIDSLKSGLGAIAGLASGLLTDSFYALSPIVNSLFDAIFKIIKPFTDLINPKTEKGRKAYQDIQNIITNLTNTLSTVSEKLAPILDVFADVAAFFVDMSSQTVMMNIEFFSDAIGLLLEVLGFDSAQKMADGKGVLGGIGDSIRSLGDACKESFQAIKDFFGSVLDDIRNLLGIGEQTEGYEEGGFFKNIEDFFNTNEFVQKVKNWVNQAFIDIGDFFKDLPNRLSGLAIHVSDIVQGLFYTTEKDPNTGEILTDDKGQVKVVKTALKEWLDHISNTVWNFITVDIPAFVKGIPSFFSELLNKLFYKDPELDQQTGEILISGKGRMDLRTPLKKWLDQAKITVNNFFNTDLPKAIKKFPSLISRLVSGLFYTHKTSEVKDPKTGQVIYKYTEKVKTPLKQWLDQAIKDVSAFLSYFINNIPNYINSAIDMVGGFIRGIVSAIFGTNTPENAGQQVENELAKPFQNISLEGIIQSIKNIGETILNNVISIFTGNTDWATNKNWLADGVALAIDWVREKGETALTSVKDWFVNLPLTISNFFHGNEENGEPSGFSKVLESIKKFGEDLWKTIQNIPNTVIQFWDNMELALGGFDQKTYDNILREGGFFAAEDYKKNHEKSIFDIVGENAAKGIEWIRTKAEKIWPDVRDWFVNLPTEISKFFSGDSSTGEPSGVSQMLKSIEGFGNDIANVILDFPKIISDAWTNFTNSLNHTISGGFDESLYNQLLGVDPSSYAARQYKDYTESQKSPIIKFFEQLIANIGDMFKTMGPSILDGINTALTWIGGKLGDFTNWLSEGHAKGKRIDEMLAEEMTSEENGEANPLFKSIQNVAQTVKDFMIKTIPQFISEAIEEIKLQIPHLLGSLFGESEQNKEVEKNASNMLTGLFGGDKFNDAKQMGEQFAKGFADGEETGLNEMQQKMYDDFLLNQGKEKAEAWKKQVIEDNKKTAEKVKREQKSSGGKSLLSSFGLISEAFADEFEESFDASSFNGDGASKKFEKGATSFLEGLGNVFGKIKDVAETIKADKILAFAALIGALAFVLSQLKDMTSLTDEVESIGWSFKWVGIGIFLTGIAALLGYLTILGSQGDQFDKQGVKAGSTLDHILTILKTFKDGVVEILQYVAWISAFLAAKEIGSAIGGRTDVTKGGLFSKLLGGFGGVIGKIAGFWLGGGMIGDLAENLSDNAGDALTNLGQGMENFSEYGISIVENLEAVNSKMEVALATIGKMKELVTSIITFTSVGIFNEDTGEIAHVDVLSNMNIMLAVFNKLSAAMLLFKNSILEDGENIVSAVDALDMLMDMQESMGEFAQFTKSEDFNLFKDGIASIGAIMQMYSTVNIPDFNKPLNEWGIENAIAMLKQLFLNDELKSLITLFSNELLPEEKEILQTAERMLIFSGALIQIAQACGMISGLESEQINGLIKLLTEIDPVDPEDENNLYKATEQLGALGNALGSFITEAAKIKGDQVDLPLIQSALDMLVKFAVGLKDLPNDAFIVEFFAGNKEIDNFGAGVQQLGGNLSSFFQSVDNIDANGVSKKYNKDNFKMAMEAAIGMARIIHTLIGSDKDILDKANGITGDLKDFAEQIGVFLADLSDIKTHAGKDFSDDDFDFIFKALDIVNHFAQSIALVMQNSNYYSGSISQAFHELSKGLFGDNEMTGILDEMWLFFKHFFVVPDADLQEAPANMFKEYLDIIPLIESWSEIITELSKAMLNISSIYTNYSDLWNGGVVDFTDLNPFEGMINGLVKSIDTLIASKESFNSLFSMASTFDRTGLNNTLTMITILNQLSSALALFEAHNMEQGLTEFETFNWVDALNAVYEQMQISGDDFLAPEITPKLIISEEFKAQAEAMRALFDPYYNNNTPETSFDPETYKWLRSVDSTGFGASAYTNWANSQDQGAAPQFVTVRLMQETVEQIKPIDYRQQITEISTQLTQLKDVTNDFGTLLRDLQFVIDGTKLTDAIGPIMDKWLGQEGSFVVRANFT